MSKQAKVPPKPGPSKGVSNIFIKKYFLKKLSIFQKNNASWKRLQIYYEEIARLFLSIAIK